MMSSYGCAHSDGATNSWTPAGACPSFFQRICITLQLEHRIASYSYTSQPAAPYSSLSPALQPEARPIPPQYQDSTDKDTRYR
jgi:hypothetical protein